MKRRRLLQAGLGAGVLGMAGCSSSPADLGAALAHVQGSFGGPDVARGHALRDKTRGDVGGEVVTRHAHTVIVGGGVAGLAAARGLRLRGRDDFVLLELEDEAGGNARATSLQGLAAPTAAHYLPVPAEHDADLQQFLADCGLLRRDALGRWQPNERHLCHSPQERLFFDGQWHAGLLPLEGVGADTLAQYRHFAELVQQARQNNRYQIPVQYSKSKPDLYPEKLAQDALTFDNFLQKNQLTDPQLRWHLSYCCRDEYGAGLHQVSAWAGIHYFAARHGFAVPTGAPDEYERSEGLFTWAQGNAWLTEQLAEPLADRLLTGQVVHRVEVQRHGVQVDAIQAHSGVAMRWQAQHVILALPAHLALRVLVNPPALLREAAQAITHAPWVVCNLRLHAPLIDRGGVAPAWDSVVYGVHGLGLVNAQHQDLHPVPTGPQVLTHYRALGDWPDPHTARAELLRQPWQHWLHQAVTELLPAHPELPEHLTHAQVVRHGHGMVIPTQGLMNHLSRLRLMMQDSSLQKSQRLHLAHSDWAGYSIFEEAFALGLQAAKWV